MAEVGQRLGTGVYRLSTLKNSRSRPVCTGESPGSLLAACTLSDSRLKNESARDQREVHRRSRATQCYSVNLTGSECKRGNATLPSATSLELDSSRFIRHVPAAALCASARLQPLLQEKLLPGRMTPWTRGAVSIHRDTFRSPQNVRAFCTVVYILAEQASRRRRRLEVHPDALHASTRGYSNGSSKHVPLLYRSRTSYYDTLKVSPNATQSQIKSAYYKQSFIYHPDKNPGDDAATQHFFEISEAYAVLGNDILRKKYDHGVLSRSHVQSPASTETTGSPRQQQQQHPYRARRSSKPGEKVMFDFDAFYQAHYGEQLQRERDMRARKQRMQEQQKENMSKWRQGKRLEVTVGMLLTVAGLLLVNLCQS
ncbi:DnaJ subfamily C member 30 [Liparis tanakae]|uniref:DnaJ subfamily C member 30 n=1 Tax=Liparis tanakae TaxID=230148 RepID=A0A4Z2IR26_9TELE|nr:DnaJ subfamily C member 30 [Liparis tanakae]